MSKVLDEVVAQIDDEIARYGVPLDNWHARFRKSYGWRAGEAYTERGASVADVLRYEQDELGNDLTVLLPLERLETLSCRDGMWLCPTRRSASAYGIPHKVGLSPRTFIVACDNDNGLYVVDPDSLP